MNVKDSILANPGTWALLVVGAFAAWQVYRGVKAIGRGIDAAGDVVGNAIDAGQEGLVSMGNFVYDFTLGVPVELTADGFAAFIDFYAQPLPDATPVSDQFGNIFSNQSGA